MNFYDELKPKSDDRVGKLSEAFKATKVRLEKTKKRLAEEVQLLGRLQTQREKLTNLSDDSLVDSGDSFDKFKVSLKKLSAQMETSNDAIQTLKNNVIPSLESEVRQSEQALKTGLNAMVKDSLGLAESEMSELAGQIVAVQDSFLNAFDRIFQENDLRFVINDRSLVPKTRHDRIKSLDIFGRSAAQRAAALAVPLQTA